MAALVEERVRRLAGAGGATAVGWMSVPRDAVVADDLLAALGLSRFSSWDWLSTAEVPPRPASADAVVRLDLDVDLDAVRDCLAEANPGTSADPTADDEVGWWGVREDAVAASGARSGGTSGGATAGGTPGGRLVGVMGASLRGGATEHDVSWHLHGLGVRPEVRGRGLGEALTAVATASGLAAGASWVSLAMYADNDPARRIYRRLGYATDARFDSYGPAGTRRPPA